MSTYRYAFNKPNGESCCRNNDPTLLCEHCRAALEAEQVRVAESTPRDSYAPDLAKLRAAAGYVPPPALPTGGAAPNPYFSVLKMRSERR